MDRSSKFTNTVRERDGYSCVKCGYQPSASRRLEAHHITPLDHGGEDTPENGATLCSLCHRYAPDWDTVIDPTAYPEAFEIYQCTWNPPAMDLFWFGMLAVDNGFMDSEEFRGQTVLEIIPHLNESNWWIVFAAMADYKSARDILPFNWPDDPTTEALQQNLSAALR